MRTHLWLRAESKPMEERTALTPRHAQQLLDAGFRVTVEECSVRAFPTADFAAVGCQIVPAHSWKSDAPQDALILGLKELERSDSPLSHRHIHFAHVYKNQLGWRDCISRFADGGGALYDLEFLVDETGRRVVAFGHWAGYAGAALAIMAWAGQKSGRQPVLEPVQSRGNQAVLVDDVRRRLAEAGGLPRVMVIGALGRSGRGAVELCKSLDIDVIAWDLEETRRGGPFAEILEADVLLNCVFVQSAVPPFVTLDMLQQVGRRLCVICDVSCDPYGDYNPLPIYEKCTTFTEPVSRIVQATPPLDLIAIDHLPSLLPVESSDDFCTQLMPHLLQLDDLGQGVWQRAFELFQEKSNLAKQEA